jgi:hypothetical protein
MSRADEIRAQRAARGNLGGSRMRLAVREEQLDRENWSYRWANDDGNRVSNLQSDGWEIVADRAGVVKDDGAGMGAEVAQLAGTKKTGEAMRSVLMRIPREIKMDDDRAKARAIDAQEASLKSGAVPGAGEGVYAKPEMNFSRSDRP